MVRFFFVGFFCAIGAPLAPPALCTEDGSHATPLRDHAVSRGAIGGPRRELYVSPATLVLYPPTGMRDTEFRWAATAGVNVPLSAHLERL